MIYELTWQNKWLTAEAKTISEMIQGLQDAADKLRAMQKKGVVLNETSSIADDYALLETDDPAVAEKFGFELEEQDEFDEVDCQAEPA